MQMITIIFNMWIKSYEFQFKKSDFILFVMPHKSTCLWPVHLIMKNIVLITVNEVTQTSDMHSFPHIPCVDIDGFHLELQIFISSPLWEQFYFIFKLWFVNKSEYQTMVDPGLFPQTTVSSGWRKNNASQTLTARLHLRQINSNQTKLASAWSKIG